MKSKNFTLFLVTLFCTMTSYAQSKINIKAGADVVSSYVWRGNYNGGASIQPLLSAGVAGVTLGAWGSVGFGDVQRKEVDLSLNYSVAGLTFGVTDYWWEGEKALRYFNYTKGSTAHRIEANIAYQLPLEKFPLIVSWNTMFAGADYNSKGERSYSSYVEISYPFIVGESVDMTAFVGAVPWHSPSIVGGKHSGFSLCNIGVGARYGIKCNDDFSIPIFSNLIFNPTVGDVHLVFGISLFFGAE